MLIDANVPAMTSYHIPAASVEVEYEIKKSRFICRAEPISDRQHAMQILQQAKRDFPDARHHCWAYVLGNQVSAAMSDDGEPTGTAGKPILNVLQHKHIGDIILVVVRYFGGIKLGAGGLVRAYSAAAQMAIDALPLTEFVSLTEVVLVFDFAQEQSVRHWAQVHDAQIHEVTYADKVSMELAMTTEQVSHIKEFALALGIELRNVLQE